MDLSNFVKNDTNASNENQNVYENTDNSFNFNYNHNHNFNYNYSDDSYNHYFFNNGNVKFDNVSVPVNDALVPVPISPTKKTSIVIKDSKNNEEIKLGQMVSRLSVKHDDELYQYGSDNNYYHYHIHNNSDHYHIDSNYNLNSQKDEFVVDSIVLSNAGKSSSITIKDPANSNALVTLSKNRNRTMEPILKSNKNKIDN